MRFYDIMIFVFALNLAALAAVGLGIFPSGRPGQVADFRIIEVEATETGFDISFGSAESVALTGIIVVGSIFTGAFISAGFGLFMATFGVYFFTILPGTLDLAGVGTTSYVGMIILVMTGVALLVAMIELLTGREVEK